MKNKYFAAVFCAFLATFCAYSCYASPFSESPKEIKLDTAASSGQKAVKSAKAANEAENNGFFSRLCLTIKKYAQKTSNELKAAVSRAASKMPSSKVSKKPAFVVRAITIPGHETNEMVFQGICSLPLQCEAQGKAQFSITPYYLLSYYPKHSNQPSQLVAVDINSKKPVMRFALYINENKPYTGHAGGIAAAGKYVWAASSHKLWGFNLQTVIDSIGDKSIAPEANKGDELPPSLKALPYVKLVMTKSVEVDSIASYVSFDGAYLWVGDFVKSSQSAYAPISHHKGTWVSGYRVNADGEPVSTTYYKYKTGSKKVKRGLKPDKIITCRESVQGFALCGSYAAVTVSFGAANSKLAIYSSPLSGKAALKSYKTESGTYSAEFFQIDKNSHLATVKIAAGAEDLSFDGQYLSVGFEGGSPNYKKRWASKPGVKIEECFYLIDLNKISGL